jgi:hypothetical protein
MRVVILALSLLAFAGCRSHGHGHGHGDGHGDGHGPRQDHGDGHHHEHGAGAAGHEHGQQPGPTAVRPRAPGENPVQYEMRLLTETLQRAVSGIGHGDVRFLAQELHQLHLAMEATEAAVRDGSYRPPRNPDRVERFLELDELFHRHLVQLVRASRQNDLDGAAQALGAAMQGCQTCHDEFRHPVVTTP